ncbi:hypothetical protein PF005_g14821 [Phytophthora fragariae]|uniref:Secreted protein n=1 Tax=Phytophthora fragariae TaxID=53985 RepID=A0A6A4DKI7_9STRA|nr:hypothetical protein PF003_g5505 [Phytophthora fragariae]KAE8941296.1 hypothetical protein PF009_g8910 [Phytophthora fragariae]KAE9010138.1 hypothetical protein PF011_g9952 [Phytophthora fragariae]KAE9096558.1 hypothetical protein PF010_g16303 [Phytophthora fragariae]KAE9112146.1 hypothetical protein PF007_g11212 [Phytophthora fragariae]
MSCSAGFLALCNSSCLALISASWSFFCTSKRYWARVSSSLRFSDLEATCRSANFFKASSCLRCSV